MIPKPFCNYMSVQLDLWRQSDNWLSAFTMIILKVLLRKDSNAYKAR